LFTVGLEELGTGLGCVLGKTELVESGVPPMIKFTNTLQTAFLPIDIAKKMKIQIVSH